MGDRWVEKTDYVISEPPVVKVILLTPTPLGSPGQIVDVDKETAENMVALGIAHRFYGPPSLRLNAYGPPQVK
jgi:hypothetical protein